MTVKIWWNRETENFYDLPLRKFIEEIRMEYGEQVKFDILYSYDEFTCNNRVDVCEHDIFINNEPTSFEEIRAVVFNAPITTEEPTYYTKSIIKHEVCPITLK